MSNFIQTLQFMFAFLPSWVWIAFSVIFAFILIMFILKIIKTIVSYTYRVRTSSSSSNPDGYLVQQLDYDANWIASLVLLIVVLFCIFKAGGALLCKA